MFVWLNVCSCYRITIIWIHFISFEDDCFFAPLYTKKQIEVDEILILILKLILCLDSIGSSVNMFIDHRRHELEGILYHETIVIFTHISIFTEILLHCTRPFCKYRIDPLIKQLMKARECLIYSLNNILLLGTNWHWIVLVLFTVSSRISEIDIRKS